ncbi:MAG: ATP-binding cassette domain-containing protein [Bryobacteraceae bacterium]|nr:ATP-binding cassette domain-containing protein [Bryobacteraceae bacterium]
MTAPLVELKNVTMRYGQVEVFRDFNLQIADGCHFALLGPSGCGKSTLLRLFAGLQPPAVGEVWVDGSPASVAGEIRLAPHKRRFTMVFQDLALWPNLTVLQNVELGLAGAGLDRRERRERALSALRACRIEELGSRRPGELSGGQQQRAALARALAPQPRALLLDEPFSGLDIAIKVHLYAEITRLCREFGVTVILVSHDPMEATALCSHGAVIEHGGVREEGRIRDLLRAPVSETLRAFVDQLPQASGGNH